MVPFGSREVGINPLAEPALLMPPAQALMPEDLAQATSFDGDAFDFAEIDYEAIQCPRVKWLIQLSRRGQSGLKHNPNLFCGVDPWTSFSGTLFQASDAQSIKPAYPATSGSLVNIQLLVYLSGKVALVREENDLSTLDATSTQFP